jgi:hypothetical protein
LEWAEIQTNEWRGAYGRLVYASSSIPAIRIDLFSLPTLPTSDDNTKI